MSKQPNITPLAPPSKDTATLPAILDMCAPDDQSVLVWRTHYWTILHSEHANNLPCSAKLTISNDGSLELAVYWPHMSVRMGGYHGLHDLAAFLGLHDWEQQQWTRDEHEERRLADEHKDRKAQAEREETQRRLALAGQAGPVARHARQF